MSGGIEFDFQVALGRITLSLAWKTGEPSLGLFGPSGAGKTTALEAIAGLRRDARGLIRVNGDTWLDSSRGLRRPPEERGVGYVPQDTLLFPHRNVMENLSSGGRRADRAGARGLKAERVVEILELGDLRSRAITALSGGERQRVALGRALCSGPGLLLLDEPLASLDHPLRRRILPYLLRVRREFGIPTIHVSHDPGEIQVLAREVTVLVSGRVVRQGRPDDVFIDPEIFPITEGGEIENVLRGTILEIAHGAAIVELEPGVTITAPAETGAVGESAIVTVRPEDLILAVDPPTGLSAQNVIPAIVHEVRETWADPTSPAQVLVALRVGAKGERVVATVTMRAREQLGLAAGRRVHLIFKAQACRIFPA